MVLIIRLAPLSIEESLKVLLVDVIQIAIINCRVCGVLAEAFRSLELLLQILTFPVHFNLHEEQFCQLFLDIKCQIIILPTHHVGPLSRLGTKLAVSARQYDLHEVRVVQLTIKIRVEKFYEIVAVSFGHI